MKVSRLPRLSLLVLVAVLLSLACDASAQYDVRTMAPGAPTSAIVTYSGKGLGGFTANNGVASPAGQFIAFKPGTTLWVVFQTTGAPTGIEVFLSSQQGSAGWVIDRSSAGEISLNTAAGSLIQLPATYNLPTIGIATLALVWRASDNNILAAVNGLPLSSGLGAVALPTPADVTCPANIGSVNGVFPTTARILAAAVWSIEATAAQVQAGTYTTGNRLSLPTVVTSNAATTWDFNAGRDWNGSSGSFTTRGSSPITFSVTGSPAPSLTAVAEIRYPAATSYYRDAKIAITSKDSNGVTFTVRDPFAHILSQTDGTYVDVEAYSQLSPLPSYAVIGANIGGAYLTEDTVRTDGVPQIVNFYAGAGIGKTVDLVEGPQLGIGSTYPLTRTGTTLQAVRLPTLALDGMTQTNSKILPVTPPAHRVVEVGDSILTAFYVTVPMQQAITPLLRASYASDGITAHAQGSEAIANLASLGIQATAALLASECDGTSTNAVWDQLQTNDYGDGVLESPIATYTTNLAALMDAFHALVPGAKWFAQSATQRISPSSEGPNTFGSTLPSYRAAKQSVCAARSSWCTYVECAAGACVSNANMYSDGLHLLTAGAVQLKTVMATTLSASNACGPGAPCL